MPAKRDDAHAPVTPPDLMRWKSEKRRITTLTAYDHPTAKLLDQAGVDVLLVGDSVGTVVQGRDSTLSVTLDQMLYHTEMVARAASRALVVGDLPFGSYQASPEQAVLSASRFFKETRCGAVKVEGGRRMSRVLRALTDADIPVMGHVGLTPQSVRKFGGHKVQRDADAIRADAQAVAEAGAFAVVLEGIPGPLAATITAELPIPTIGIGAGVECDGQVLVTPDLLGLFTDFRPRFVRRYADMAGLITEAVTHYVDDVRNGRYPGPSETYR
jgi:3-methyl-2-oxobutanoate hydroxymethyltransferase